MSETETALIEPATASAPAPAAPPPAKRWTRFITPALALVAALVIGGLAGVFIGQNTGRATGGPSGFVPREGGPQVSGGPNGSDLTAGTIESIDGDTITVKLADGSTITVTTSDETEVTKTTDATVGELAPGDEIAVVGEQDDDGNVTADQISEGGGGPFGAQFSGPQTNSNGD